MEVRSGLLAHDGEATESGGPLTLEPDGDPHGGSIGACRQPERAANAT